MPTVYSEPPPAADDAAHAVIGAALEVHKVLGPGHLECAYHRALEIELALRGIAFEREKNVEVFYKGERVGQLRLDLVVASSIVVELKSVDALVDLHFSQLVSYLRATDLPLGLLLNFNTKLLKNGIRRVIRPPR